MNAIFGAISGEIPAFSIFSATSEIFVTIAVIYCVLKILRGGTFHKRILGATLLFELCFNVVYMARSASKVDVDEKLSTGLIIFAAGHGILSLLMFIGLAVIYVLSLADESSGRELWFRRHRAFTWVFLFFWMVSVISGEAIFVLRYL